MEQKLSGGGISGYGRGGRKGEGSETMIEGKWYQEEWESEGGDWCRMGEQGEVKSRTQ